MEAFPRLAHAKKRISTHLSSSGGNARSSEIMRGRCRDEMDKLIQGEVISERNDWFETLGYGSDRFVRNLLDLGIEPRILKSDIAKYEEAQKIFESPIGPKGPDAHTNETNRRDAI